MNRKLFSSLLGLAVVAVLFVGCSSQATSSDADSVGLDVQAVDTVDSAEACAKQCPMAAKQCTAEQKAACSEKKEECTGDKSGADL